MNNFKFLAMILSCLYLFTGCALTRPLEEKVSYLVVSNEAETEMGDEYADQISKEYNLLEDPGAQAWLERVGQKLVDKSPETSQTFKFAVTDSEQVNAFAIPGGYCYVNQGLIRFADNEAQVVAVIGHEINHVTGRHGILRYQRELGIGLIGAVATTLFTSPEAKAAAAAGTAGGAFLASRQYSQSDELDADKKGTQAMYEAGWDPREAAAFFRKLQALNEDNTPSFLESFLSTHPQSTRRAERIDKMVTGYSLTNDLTVNTEEFIALQNRLHGIYGAAPGDAE